ncbi:NA (modular protein) [Desulfamplus magnetovallimortis]|uniref:NA (Modular protein) n=1 Tax=Desulfamplus magnetovallimortis TaxID=1246637 RepID=A0A1W1HC41_9BACT|nr:methyltransferase domain-containing protein [Desulfamplus magnetovallimortis]SLM29955.1 NA (modular protein) [Desulfamplus magnetovallimortis]
MGSDQFYNTTDYSISGANKNPDIEIPDAESYNAVDYFSLSHPLRGFTSRIVLQSRQNMFKMFMKTMKPSPLDLVVDVGITPDTTLKDSNFFEKLYPYPERLVTTSIENASNITKIFPMIRFVRTPGDALPFRDNAFDFLFCSAVLEHVGDDVCQKKFIKEILRISKQFFITTPNRMFPVEFHTFLPLIHWLPRRYHQTILSRTGNSFWSETENLNLITPQKLRTLFPDNSDLHINYHFLMGIPSNIIAYGRSPENQLS